MDMISGTAFKNDNMGSNNGKTRKWPGNRGKSDSLLLQRELDCLGFLATFAKEVSVSLNPDEVLKTAAKQLYDYFHYSFAIFSLSEGFGGLTGYSPLDPAGCRRNWPKVVKEFPDLKYRDICGHRLMGLTAPVLALEECAHEITIELGDGYGAMRLFCNKDSAGLSSHKLLKGIAESLTTSLRNAREHDRVKELSLRDSLTGLFNRRVLEEILNLEENKRKPAPLSALILDVDDFKLINDTFGHPAGDHVLSQIGKLLMDNSRKENIVARYGGEEFAILLTNTGLDTALQIAERLRIKLGEQEFTFSGRKVRLSVSIGVAHNDGQTSSQESIMSRADKALYQAKSSGKNRVCFNEAPIITRIPEKGRRPHIRLAANRFDGALIV
jgi:two-component system, cell cycle response regulator